MSDVEAAKRQAMIAEYVALQARDRAFLAENAARISLARSERIARMEKLLPLLDAGAHPPEKA